MTGGGGLLVTLVIDFYVNDDNDNDKEPTIGTHTRALLLIVDELHAYTRMRAFLSLSPLSLSVAFTAAAAADDDDARNGEQRQCS